MKRILDFAAALIGLMILAPVALVIVVLVRLFLGSPVLFTQRRPGLNAAPFRLMKFRTMSDEKDVDGTLMPDALRLTRVGRFLRSTSLDELPELLNVVRGEMSLVGPRPLLVEYLPFYSEEHSRRHEVRPGITGLAQVKGRNALTWEEKFDLDVWYVDNRTFRLDLAILFWTVGAVLSRRGVSAPGSETMPRFEGPS